MPEGVGKGLYNYIFLPRLRANLGSPALRITTSPPHHTLPPPHTHTHTLSLFSTLPRTHRRPRRPTIPIPIPTVPVTSTTKPKTPNPPRQRIPHRIHRPLRTPQTNLPLPVRNIEKFDTRPRPQAVAAAVVLGVLRKDETPEHGHVPAEGEGGPGEGLEADGGRGWDCVIVSVLDMGIGQRRTVVARRREAGGDVLVVAPSEAGR